MRIGMLLCVSVCCAALSAGAAGAASKVTTASGDNAILQRQMRDKMVSCEIELKRLEREHATLLKDKKDLRKALDSIVVQDFKFVTNTVRLAGGGYKTTVTKLNYKQDARVRRLIKILKNPSVNKLYEKYCDKSCIELLEEFQGEWKMAQESYADTKEKMKHNNKAYESEVRKIDEDVKREYDESMKRIDDQIAQLKRVRAQYIMRKGFSENPPQVRQIDAKVRELERDRETTRKIYNSNKYAQSYAKAGSNKTDANDEVLASADLRNQLQSIYMHYSNRVKDDLVEVINKRINDNRKRFSEKTVEQNRLKFFVQNPDMINGDVASAIIDKQVGEAITELFKVDVKQMDKDYEEATEE